MNTDAMIPEASESPIQARATTRFARPLPLVSGLLAVTLIAASAFGQLKRRIDGTFADGSFGASVSGAGDVNGDGTDDVIVGAPKAPGRFLRPAGVARVLSGDDGSTIYFFLGRDGEAFGSSVSGAGDANGDGYADVITRSRKNAATARWTSASSRYTIRRLLDYLRSSPPGSCPRSSASPCTARLPPHRPRRRDRCSGGRAARRLGLSLETQQAVLLDGRDGRGQDLQRCLASELGVHGQEYRTLSATPEFANHAVASDRISVSAGHWTSETETCELVPLPPQFVRITRVGDAQLLEEPLPFRLGLFDDERTATARIRSPASGRNAPVALLLHMHR